MPTTNSWCKEVSRMPTTNSWYKKVSRMPTTNSWYKEVTRIPLINNEYSKICINSIYSLTLKEKTKTDCTVLRRA
jgi:hypothetical protein